MTDYSDTYISPEGKIIEDDPCLYAKNPDCAGSGIQNPYPASFDVGTWIKANPFLAAAAALFLITMFSGNKKVSGMNIQKLLVPAAIAAAVYFLFIKKGGAAQTTTATDPVKVKYLQDWINTLPPDNPKKQSAMNALTVMSADEINDLFTIVHDYFNVKGRELYLENPPLQERWIQIYNQYLGF